MSEKDERLKERIFKISNFLLGLEAKNMEIDKSKENMDRLHKAQDFMIRQFEDNKENFILYTYNNFCTFKVPCDEIFNESIKELNITILKIPFDEFKTTSLYNEVNYAPSVILIKEGKIIEYIDPEKNDDLSKYQDKKEFISWIKEYINI